MHASPPTLGDPVHLTIHSPADFAAATAAMATLAWGDAPGDARLDVSIAAGDYAGRSLQLKQDPNAKHPVTLVVHGEGRARVASLALDLEAASVTVADLVFDSAPTTYALKVRTPGQTNLARLAFLDQVVGAKAGPATGGVVLLEASSAAATATLTDCAFVGGSARRPVPMVTLAAQPASMFARIDLVRAVFADAEFPTLISLAAAQQLTLEDSVVVLRPGTRLVRAEAPWAQLVLRSVTVVADGPDQVLERSGATAPPYEASSVRVAWRKGGEMPAGAASVTLSDDALTQAVAGLREALRSGPIDPAAFQASAKLR